MGKNTYKSPEKKWGRKGNKVREEEEDSKERPEDRGETCRNPLLKW